MAPRPRPPLRDFLQATAPGNHVVAYLTIGDPNEGFLELAGEILDAGALTLELGFPHPAPLEGPTLLASHARAIAAGVDTRRALALLRSVAERSPQTPLVAVVQWPAIADETRGNLFLDDLVASGAAAILPVGLPLWVLPAFAKRAAERDLQNVFACPSDASPKFREIALRFCTGFLYVPRGRLTGSAEKAGDVDAFCRAVAGRSDLPIVVGVGVKTAQDVAEICRGSAKAAAVGTALVDQIMAGGSAGEFIRRLIGR